MYGKDWFSAPVACRRPSQKQTQRIKTQFEVVIVPYNRARVNRSRGKRHGEAQWKKTIGKQETPAKVRKGTTMLPSCSDGRMTESIETLRKFLGGHKITVATWTTYENTILLVSNDDKQAGPMRARKDFMSTTQNLAALHREQGRQNAYIPKNERARRRAFMEGIVSRPEMAQPKLEIALVANFFFIIFTTMVETAYQEVSDLLASGLGG